MKFRFLITLFTIATLISCKRDNNKTTTTDNKSQEIQTITIGMVTFPGYAPLYLAKEKGFFKDVNVKIARIEAIGDIRAAMNSGNIDIYAATHDIFQATERITPPGVGFLAIDESKGGDGVVVSEDIKSLADLKGKTLGAEPGLPPYFILQYMLNQAGLTLQDVDFKDIATQDAGNAFVAKRLDAAGVYEPVLSISAEKRKGAKVLVSSSDTPGLIVDFLFASNDLAENHPEVLSSIAKGWFQAVDYWKNNEDESMAIMAKAFGVDKAEMMDIKSGIDWLTLDQNKKLFSKSSENNAYKTFELVGDILEKNNSANVRVSSQDKLTSKIIESL